MFLNLLFIAHVCSPYWREQGSMRWKTRSALFPNAWHRALLISLTQFVLVE